MVDNGHNQVEAPRVEVPRVEVPRVEVPRVEEGEVAGSIGGLTLEESEVDKYSTENNDSVYEGDQAVLQVGEEGEGELNVSTEVDKVGKEGELNVSTEVEDLGRRVEQYSPSAKYTTKKGKRKKRKKEERGCL